MIMHTHTASVTHTHTDPHVTSVPNNSQAWVIRTLSKTDNLGHSFDTLPQYRQSLRQALTRYIIDLLLFHTLSHILYYWLLGLVPPKRTSSISGVVKTPNKRMES